MRCEILFYILGTYELLKTLLVPENLSNPPSWSIFLAAGTGGTLYWVLTFPIDVVKSTLQSDESEKSQRKFKGVVDCAKRLYWEEGGWRRFFKGFSPCLMRAVPANVTMLWVVEKCRVILDPYIWVSLKDWYIGCIKSLMNTASLNGAHGATRWM